MRTGSPDANATSLTRTATDFVSLRADSPDRAHGAPATLGPGYIFSFQPTRMSQVFTGHAVKKPMTMPICIMNQ